MYASFRDLRRAVPSIHVYKRIGGGGAFEVSILIPQDRDETHNDQRWSERYTVGDGSKKNPYTYESVVDVSPHYAVIDLWYQFRDVAMRTRDPVYITVNDWVLRVGSEGVTAEDGHFTKLV